MASADSFLSDVHNGPGKILSSLKYIMKAKHLAGLNLYLKALLSLNNKVIFSLSFFELLKIFIITDHLDLCSSTLKFTYFLFELCKVQ